MVLWRLCSTANPLPTVVQELQDAEALRRPLCALYGVEPQRLVPAAVPPAELLGGAGGQPVAFLPAGALRLLDSVTRGELAGLVHAVRVREGLEGCLQLQGKMV